MTIYSHNVKKDITTQKLIKELMNSSKNKHRLTTITLIAGLYFETSTKTSTIVDEICQLTSFSTNNSDVLKVCVLLESKKDDYLFSFLRSMISIWILCTPKINLLEKLDLIIERLLSEKNTNSLTSIYWKLRKNTDSKTDTINIFASRIKLFSTAIMDVENFSTNDFKRICKDIGLNGFLMDVLITCRNDLFNPSVRPKRKKRILYFIYSFNQIKKGLARLPEEKVDASLADTINVLTRKPLDMDPVYSKAIDWAVEIIMKQADWKKPKFADFMNSQFKVPFFSSTFETSKSNGGGKNRLHKNNIKNQDELESDYMLIYDINNLPERENRCRFAALVEPNKVRPITIQGEEFQQGAIPMKNFLIDTWKRTTFSTMHPTWKDDITSKHYFKEGVKLCSVDYTAATNFMKPEATKYALKTFHSHMEKLWSDDLRINMEEFFAFNEQCVDMRDFRINKSVEICGGNLRDINWLNIRDNLEQDILDQFPLHTVHDDGSTSILKEDAKAERLVRQLNGQLMGNPLSFVLLCTINLASIIIGYVEKEDLFWNKSFDEYCKNQEIPGRIEELLDLTKINGDDAFYPTEDLKKDPHAHDCFEKQKVGAASFGLQVNDLKTWKHNFCGSLNSVMFIFNNDGTLEEVPYLNLSVLWNNNIKNTIGIDKTNIASCTEYIFNTGPNRYDDVTFRYCFDDCDGGILEPVQGDQMLAESFYNYQSFLVLTRSSRKKPYIGGLGFELEFEFLPNQVPEVETTSIKKTYNLVPIQNWFTAECFQEQIMFQTGKVFNDLYTANFFIPDSSGRPSKDIKLLLSDFVMNDYKFKHFSDRDILYLDYQKFVTTAEAFEATKDILKDIWRRPRELCIEDGSVVSYCDALSSIEQDLFSITVDKLFDKHISLRKYTSNLKDVKELKEVTSRKKEIFSLSEIEEVPTKPLKFKGKVGRKDKIFFIQPIVNVSGNFLVNPDIDLGHFLKNCSIDVQNFIVELSSTEGFESLFCEEQKQDIYRFMQQKVYELEYGVLGMLSTFIMKDLM